MCCDFRRLSSLMAARCKSNAGFGTHNGEALLWEWAENVHNFVDIVFAKCISVAGKKSHWIKGRLFHLIMCSDQPAAQCVLLAFGLEWLWLKPGAKIILPRFSDIVVLLAVCVPDPHELLLW